MCTVPSLCTSDITVAVTNISRRWQQEMAVEGMLEVIFAVAILAEKFIVYL
jgi:hypothetical protein